MGATQRRATNPLPIVNLLTDRRYAGLWAVVRVLLGWAWLQAGWRMAQDASWMKGDRLSCAVQPGVATAKSAVWRLACQSGHPAWLDGAAGVWEARVVAVAVTLLGIAVILGLLTMPAILLGGLAVVIAIPPPAPAWLALQLAAVAGLLAAHGLAGRIGIDRWLLPLWQKGWRGHRPPGC